MFMAVGTPRRDRPTAAPLGALVATYQVDDSLAGAIKQATNSDVVFFALDTLNQPVVVGSTVPAPDIGPALQSHVKMEVLAADTGGEGMALAASVGQQHLIGLAGAIRSPSGDVRGGFVALRSRESELAAFNALRRTMLWAVALGVVLALIFAFVQARQIAGPVRRLAIATRQVQDGEYSVEIDVTSRDEIGILSQAFKALVADLKAKAALVEGTSLKQLITSRGKLPVTVALTVGKQLCRALEVAHAEGVIHRDIKPQNIVVEPSGFLKVMDFGIARLANPPQGKGLTEAGTSIGTPDYMSPEQLSGAELDPRSDLYAAGVVLFACLTGRVPLEAETTWALVAKHLEEEPPDPRRFNADVPPALAAVILKAMAKNPAARYATATEMHDALARIG